MAERVDKPELVQRVARRLDRDGETVGKIVDGFLEEIYAALKRGDTTAPATRRSLRRAGGPTRRRSPPPVPAATVPAARAAPRLPTCWPAWTTTATRCCALPPTSGYRSTTTRPSGTSGWPSCSRRSAAAGARWLARSASAACAATWRPPASSRLGCFLRCGGCSRATPGCRPRPARNTPAPDGAC